MTYSSLFRESLNNFNPTTKLTSLVGTNRMYCLANVSSSMEEQTVVSSLMYILQLKQHMQTLHILRVAFHI